MCLHIGLCGTGVGGGLVYVRQALYQTEVHPQVHTTLKTF